MRQCDVVEATHVKLADGTIEKIASKWGVGENHHLAKPSEGGFGVVTDTGKRISMYDAHSYWREVTMTRKQAVAALLDAATRNMTPGNAHEMLTELKTEIETRIRAIEDDMRAKGQEWG